MEFLIFLMVSPWVENNLQPISTKHGEIALNTLPDVATLKYADFKYAETKVKNSVKIPYRYRKSRGLVGIFQEATSDKLP